MTDDADPWRVPVVGGANTGHRTASRDRSRSGRARCDGGSRAACARFCRRSASFDLTPKSGGRVHVAGRVRARVGQTCVVTLDPIENDIDEAIDLIFAPPEQIPRTGRSGRRGGGERRRNSRSAGADRERHHRSRPACDRRAVSWRSIPIRASRTRFSSRWSRPPIPRIIRLPR